MKIRAQQVDLSKISKRQNRVQPAKRKGVRERKIDPRLLGPANLHRLRTHADKAVASRAATVIDDLKGPEQKEKETLIAQLRAEVVKPGNAASLFSQADVDGGLIGGASLVAADFLAIAAALA